MDEVKSNDQNSATGAQTHDALEPAGGWQHSPSRGLHKSMANGLLARIQWGMIEVTRLSGTTLVLNADLIEAIEGAPDTTVLLANGRRYMVKEAVVDLLEKIAAWKRRCWQSPLAGEAAEARRLMAERAEQES